jgi:hypothetical protein
MAQAKIPFDIMPGTAALITKGSKWIDAVYLALAGTAETYTVPEGVFRIMFSCPYNFWARYEGTPAAVPSSDLTNGTGAELNPAGRIVQPGDTISLVSQDAACPISIACFA